MGLLVPVLLAAAPLAAWAQTGAVAGRVSSERGGAPIAAAQVTIPELGVTTLTAADGSFTLARVPPGRHELRVIRIGYHAATVPIDVLADDTVQASLRMAEVPLALDEIVVTGTVGQARRREVGNSIAQIKAEDIAQPVQTLEALLQGRTAGIVIPSGTADMGSGQGIRLRGNASLSLVSYPLVYIDGIRQTASAYRSTRSAGQTSMISDIDPATSSAWRSSRDPRPRRSMAPKPPLASCRSSPRRGRPAGPSGLSRPIKAYGGSRRGAPSRAGTVRASWILH